MRAAPPRTQRTLHAPPRTQAHIRSRPQAQAAHRVSSTKPSSWAFIQPCATVRQLRQALAFWMAVKLNFTATSLLAVSKDVCAVCLFHDCFQMENRRLTSMVDPLHESDLIATRWREGWLPPYCCQNAMALMVLAACCTVGSLNCPVLFLYSYSYLRCGGMRRACCRGCRASCC